jgi:hypothetical protein
MPISVIPDTPQQKEFDAKYITVSELRRLADNAAPSTVLIARNEGRLPGAIACNGGYVWERDKLTPFLNKFIAAHRTRISTTSTWPDAK